MKFYPNVELSKKALNKKDFDELTDYMIGDYQNFPTYNFLKKDEVPTNKIEKAIVKMLGDQNYHIEYWHRYNDSPIWHVDGDEITQKNHPGKYPVELSIASYVVYIKINCLRGGEFEVLPYNTYVKGRPLLDTNYKPLENSPNIIFFPKENTCIKMINNPYHRVKKILEGFRLALIFSLWDHIPRGYKEHNHWKQITHDCVVPTKWPLKE